MLCDPRPGNIKLHQSEILSKALQISSLSLGLRITGRGEVIQISCDRGEECSTAAGIVYFSCLVNTLPELMLQSFFWHFVHILVTEAVAGFRVLIQF